MTDRFFNELARRALVVEAALGMLSPQERNVLEDFERVEEKLTNELGDLPSDSSLDLVFEMAIKEIPGSESVLGKLANIEDQLLSAGKDQHFKQS